MYLGYTFECGSTDYYYDYFITDVRERRGREGFSLISDNVGQEGGEGSEIAEFSWTSFMDGPLGIIFFTFT